jgi:hypothetical protein
MAEGGWRNIPAQNRNLSADGAEKADKVGRALRSAPSGASGQSEIRHPKSALVKLAIAAVVAGLTLAGWYFGVHAPEQKRIELARIEAQRAEAERQRAEQRRIELARIEAQRVEQARLESERARAEAENRARAQQEAQRHAARQAFPQPGQPHENTLGMKFVPVPGTAVLFSIWETRVQDFDAFVRETGHDATQGMYSDRGNGWKQQGDTWRSPGFPQGPTHPVVGVNQADAKAFCEWLTKEERAAAGWGRTSRIGCRRTRSGCGGGAGGFSVGQPVAAAARGGQLRR